MNITELTAAFLSKVSNEAYIKITQVQIKSEIDNLTNTKVTIRLLVKNHASIGKFGTKEDLTR